MVGAAQNCGEGGLVGPGGPSFCGTGQGTWAKEWNKRPPTLKEKIKLSLYEDDMLFYIENPKGWTAQK